MECRGHILGRIKSRSNVEHTDLGSLRPFQGKAEQPVVRRYEQPFPDLHADDFPAGSHARVHNGKKNGVP